MPFTVSLGLLLGAEFITICTDCVVVVEGCALTTSAQRIGRDWLAVERPGPVCTTIAQPEAGMPLATLFVEVVVIATPCPSAPTFERALITFPRLLPLPMC